MQPMSSTKGLIIIPAEILKKGRHYSGEKFEVEEKGGKIILSPVKKPHNGGFAKLLQRWPPG